MAQDAVNAILEGLKTHQAKVLQQTQLAIEKQRADAQTEAEQARIQQQQDQLEQAKKEFDANHELAKKAADLMHLQVMNKFGQQYQETGIAPPGASFQPTVQGSGGPASPVNPAAATSQLMSIPGVGDMQVATPEANATRQAGLQRITGAPAEEAKTREEQAKQVAETVRQVALKREDLDRLNASKQYDREVRKEQMDAEMARLKYTQDQENYRARLKNQGDQTDLSPYMAQALNGEMTQEDIKKLPLKPVDQMKIINGVVAPGGKVINNSTKQNLQDMSTISTAIPQIDQTLQLLKNNPVQVRLPGTDAFKQYNQSIQQLELILPQVARVIAGDKGRLTNQQMELANGGFIPSKNPLKSDLKSNIKNREDFVNLMKDILNNHLTGMSPEHKALLKQNFGIKPLGAFGAASETQGPPQGVSDPIKLSPAALQLMQKYGIQ